VKVSVLRIGHRAFGADRIYMTGIDRSVADSVAGVARRWGGSDFQVEVIDDWKALTKNWKKRGGKVAHLTMYGINIDGVARSIRRERELLVIIGSEKVPREAYELADYNIAIGNQPHSEIAALAIFLDRVFGGKQLAKRFSGGRLRIVPTEKGKKVREIA
jgi:tRNA (cytidine56-2'-O)-methyltransferase